MSNTISVPFVLAKGPAGEAGPQGPSGIVAPGGDLTGSSTAQQVVGIKGQAISATPTAGTALVSSGTTMVPQGVRSLFNVLSGGVSTSAQMQATINAAGQTGSVYFPPGRYMLDYPLKLNLGTQHIFGEGGKSNSSAFGASSVLRCSSYYGPAIIMEPLLTPGVSKFVHYDTVSTVTYLRMYGSTTPPANTAKNPFINLNSNAAGNLNGLGTLTFEINTIPHGDSTNFGNLVVSGGRRTPHDVASHHRAFQLTTSRGLTGPYDVTVLISTTNNTNATFTATGALPVDGSPHALAVTYDGANVKLYVDGVQKGTGVAATGTIVQKWYECWLIGNSGDDESAAWPEGTGNNYCNNTSVGNIRISKNVRYTTNYTASALTGNLGFDSNTRLLMLFDSAKIDGAWVIAQTNGDGHGNILGTNNPAWFKINNVLSVQTDGNGGNTIENIWIQSFQDCVAMEISVGSNFRDVNFAGIRCLSGYNNCYYGDISGCSFQISGGNLYSTANLTGNTCNAWGWYYNGASGIHHIDNCSYAVSSGWGGVLIVGNDTVIDNVLLNTTNGYGFLYASQSSFDARGFVAGDEGNVGFSDYMMILNNCQNVKVTSGATEITNGSSTATYLMLIDQGVNIALAMDWSVNGNKLIHVIAPPYNAIDLQGCSQFVALGGTYIPSPPSILAGQWFDGYAKVIFSATQERENNTINFTSDANMTVGYNDFLWGILTFTDTSSLLTTARSVFLPDLPNYVRTIRNKTAQILNVGSAFTGTVAVAAGATVQIMSPLTAIAGTVVPSNGSGFLITGTGTSFTTKLFVGEPIYLSANVNPANVNFPYIVASIADNTHLNVINQLVQASGSSQQLLVPQWQTV